MCCVLDIYYILLTCIIEWFQLKSSLRMSIGDLQGRLFHLVVYMFIKALITDTYISLNMYEQYTVNFYWENQ